MYSHGREVVRTTAHGFASRFTRDPSRATDSQLETFVLFFTAQLKKFTPVRVADAPSNGSPPLGHGPCVLNTPRNQTPDAVTRPFKRHGRFVEKLCGKIVRALKRQPTLSDGRKILYSILCACASRNKIHVGFSFSGYRESDGL